MTRRVFIDMDGVLVDFDGGYERTFGERPDFEADNVDWSRVHAVPGFFRALEPMHDAHELWAVVSIHAPTILTGIPRSLPYVADEKREWITERLGAHVPVITCLSRDKHQHGHPGDILIDDRAKCGLPWQRMGGVWIQHTSAEKSIAELAQVLATVRA